MTAVFERLLRRIFELSSGIAFFVLFLFGAVMMLAAAASGVAFVPLPMPGGATKEVGYYWAANWSFMILFGFPIMFFFMIETATALNRTLYRLTDRRMIVGADWRPVGVDALSAERTLFWRRSGVVFALLLPILMGYCLWEWWRVSGYHLIWTGELPLKPGETHWLDELDWSVAALLAGPAAGEPVSRWLNAAFSLVNYAVLGAYLSVIFTYYAMILLYAEMFRRMSVGKAHGGLRIVPEIDDEDPRRGFGVFEQVFRCILFATLLGFTNCYLMNIQNLFLRSDRPDLWNFASEHVSPGVAAMFDGEIAEGLGSVWEGFGKVDYAFNLSSVWAVMMVFGFFSAVALALAWTLSQAAEQGREELRRYIRREDSDLSRLTAHPREAALRRLDETGETGNAAMQVWPFGWPRLSQLLLLLAFGAICILFYPVGLFFAGVGIAWVLISASGIFRKG